MLMYICSLPVSNSCGKWKTIISLFFSFLWWWVDPWNSEFNCLFIAGEKGILPWGLRNKFCPFSLSSSFKFLPNKKLSICEDHISVKFEPNVLVMKLQVVNMVDGSHDMACTVLFSPFDLLRVIFVNHFFKCPGSFCDWVGGDVVIELLRRCKCLRTKWSVH